MHNVPKRPPVVGVEPRRLRHGVPGRPASGREGRQAEAALAPAELVDDELLDDEPPELDEPLVFDSFEPDPDVDSFDEPFDDDALDVDEPRESLR